jgi:PPOX class probable FMN-dependent enzyme
MAHRTIDTIEQLERLYAAPKGTSLSKEIPKLNAHYRAFVEAAPFILLATSGPGGLDCSPKGDGPGFVKILDDRTVAIPDRPGNNRLDGLRNIVADPRVALLFIVPGVGETLRVNGRAVISDDPELLAMFEVNGKLPRTVTVVTIDAAYIHCPKAFIRSHLWNPAHFVERTRLPTLGQMAAAFSNGEVDAAAYDREAPARYATQLY